MIKLPIKQSVFFEIKTLSKTLDDPKGFIGKTVPLTPTFLGYHILNQYFSNKNAKLCFENKEVV